MNFNFSQIGAIAIKTVDGIKISLIFEQSNAYGPIDCKLELVGVSTLVRLEQRQNAYSSIVFKIDGISTFAKS